MQYTIQQLRQKILQPVFDVYDVFRNYFGDAYVDLQHLPPDEYLLPDNVSMAGLSEHDIPDPEMEGLIFRRKAYRPFILVWWPEVKVTNENDKSVIIKDLYAKIVLDGDGKIPVEMTGFTLNRSSYTIDQWTSNYMHSHIQRIPKDTPTMFQTPCLGRGPIISTINALKSDLSEGFDEIRWMLFCEELSRYVTVESLTGIPYRHLEEIVDRDELTSYKGFNASILDIDLPQRRHASFILTKDRLKEFILYYLRNGHLIITYTDREYKVGMSYYEYIMDISNAFIDWFNLNYHDPVYSEKVFEQEILNHVVIAGRKFFRADAGGRHEDLTGYIGREVCKFHGQTITLSIQDDSSSDVQRSNVLNNTIAMCIVNNILRIINYQYTNERRQNEGASPIGKRYYYI